ncbi:MAG: hypothetical protein ACRDHN_11880, partial [Thermomicrobiales bacterium]
VVAVLMLVGFAWFYSAYFGTSPSNNTPTQIIATLTPFDQSELNIPSPTPKPPTPTPTVEATATTPPEPTPTPTEEADAADQTISDTAGDTGEPIDTPTEEPSANGETITDSAVSGLPSIQIVAIGDIYVEVTVDGTQLFAGNLASGDSTQFYNGEQVMVYSTDPSLTEFTSGTESTPFSMLWNDDNTVYFP